MCSRKGCFKIAMGKSIEMISYMPYISCVPELMDYTFTYAKLSEKLTFLIP